MIFATFIRLYIKMAVATPTLLSMPIPWLIRAPIPGILAMAQPVPANTLFTATKAMALMCTV